MLSKKFFTDAINHKKSDMIPIDFGGTLVTGIHVKSVAALRDYYGLEKRPVKVYEPYQMLGYIDNDLKEAIGVNVEGVEGRNTMFGFPIENWKEWRLDNGLEVLVPGNFNTTIDSNGNTYIYPEGDTSVPPSGKMPKGGYYFDAIVRQEEFDEEELDPQDNLEEFKYVTEEDITHFKTSLEAAANTGRGVIANFGGTGLGDIALVPALSLKHPKGIRDIEEWYISTVIRQDYIHHIFDKQTDIAIENLKKLNEAAGQFVDVIFICGTDFGTQTGTFCSPETFKELYMPYYMKLNDWIHKNTCWKTFKHSCGSVVSLMDLFIEAGFDIINPVQCSATGMDAKNLKDKFGDRIVFWGGGVDTQNLLPFGTPNEIRKQVLERCEIFSENGGYVFNAIHNVQANIPVENIIAMIDAVHEFNKK
jgi:hypothetical protein